MREIQREIHREREIETQRYIWYRHVSIKEDGDILTRCMDMELN